MDPITRIVVGVDGSEGGLAAAAWAARWAADLALPVHLVTASPAAVQLAGGTTPLSDTHWEELVDHLAAEAATRLEDISGRLQAENPDIAVTTEAVRGHPAASLLDSVQQGDVLVVGRTGITGWVKRVVGGVAEEVTTYAEVPVMVVPHVAVYSPSRPVVAGIDMDSSTAALAMAVWDASSRSRGLHLLSVNDMGDITDGFVTLLNNELPGHMRRRLRSLHTEALDSIQAQNPDLAVSSSVVDGDAAEQLVDAGQKASLLVVGSRGHGGFTRLRLGSTSHSLVREANCPVLVVPERLGNRLVPASEKESR